MADYIGCTVCGIRYVGDSEIDSSGCYNCGSSMINLEANISKDVERILREYGCREAKPEKDSKENSQIP